MKEKRNKELMVTALLSEYTQDLEKGKDYFETTIALSETITKLFQPKTLTFHRFSFLLGTATVGTINIIVYFLK